MVNDVNFIPEQLWNDEFRFLKIRPKGKEPTSDMGEWQKKNFHYLDKEFSEWIMKGGNYGVIGGYGNLILIDADSEEICKIAETLPETFTIKTGSPEPYKKHFFYICDVKLKPIRLSKEKIGDLGDIRSSGQYVVGAGSTHPLGNKYEVINDIGIMRITEEKIREAFKDYINPQESTEFKDYKIDTKLRNSKFIRECLVPDYAINNKLKGNSSKNWQLFRYLVDILHSREVSIDVYKQLVRTQGHSDGAIKGWVKKAHEGKLAKTSCKEMREYIKRFHPELVEEICGQCKLYKTIKKKENVAESKDYTKLQKEVLIYIISKDREKASEVIVEEIEKSNFIFTTRDDLKSEMWIYSDGIYIPQGKTFIKETCRKILGEAFTTQLCNMVIAKVEADTYIDHDEFFKTNYIDEIPLINGILNVRTRELSEHTPKKIFFNKLPIIYDPTAECPNIIKHFQTILKDKEDIPVMLELFGYLLLKEYRFEKAFMFIGNGRNGKSKTIELMKRFVGAENCSSLPLKSLHEESFSLSELFGKMANLSADLSKTDLKETGMIKALIGRDFIQAKRKFLRDLNFVNYAKMVFGANELPKIYDTTDGFWTKWVLLEFPYKFVSESAYSKMDEEEKRKCRIIDPDIISKITTSEELSGLLNMSLDALERLIENKDFSYSKGTQDVKDLWIRKSDPFTAFCYDCIEEEVGNKVKKNDLRRLFYAYRQKHKVHGCSDKAIGITLDNLYGVSEWQDWSGNRERYWEGIKINEENIK